MASPIENDAKCLMEATSWCTHLMEHDLETTPELEMWLAAEARHRWAWERVRGPWNFIGEHQNSPELLELRRAALESAREAARIRWNEPSSSETADTRFSQTEGQAEIVPLVRRRLFKTRLRTIAAAAVVALVALTAWYLQSSEVYRTQKGERRMVTLTDGSQVQLDSSTTVSVSYTAHGRNLALLKGQARFDVAHDVERPFTVSAGGRRVVATGTSFDVDLLNGDLIVTLIEGHVVVLSQASLIGQLVPAAPTKKPAAASLTVSKDTSLDPIRPLRTGGQGIELDAGQQLVFSGGGDTRVSPANIARNTAWQNGQLVFDNETLEYVVQRVNRYAPRPLILDDPHASALRISGVFNTGDVDGLVDTLTRYLPLDAERGAGGIHLRHR